MERTDTLKAFFCKLHPEEAICKISYDSTNISLYCSKCVLNLDTNLPKNLICLEDFIKQAAKDQTQVKGPSGISPRPLEIIDEVLAREEKTKAQITAHIEKEKVKTNLAFDFLKEKMLERFERKRAEALKLLDDQLVTLEFNHNLFNVKVEQYREGAKKYMTVESINAEINRMEDSKEFEKFLALLHSEMIQGVGLSDTEDEELMNRLLIGVKDMGCALSGLASKRPVSMLGKQIESEDFVSKRIQSFINCLNEIHINLIDPIPKLTSDSLIFQDTKYLKLIKQWLTEAGANTPVLEPIYRGSRDGFTAKDFHKKCDNKGPTVVLIQGGSGEVFGGYSPVSWTSNGASPYLPTDKSFLFSLDTEEKLPVKDEEYAVYSHSSCGPCWGSECDLVIGDHCNEGGNYSEPGYSYEGLIGRAHFAFDKEFIVKEIEVFALQPQWQP